MTKRFVLVEYDPDEMPDKLCPEGLVTAIYHAGVRSADVTDLVTYNKTTPGDPWDKPYPAMYVEMMERLQPS